MTLHFVGGIGHFPMSKQYQHDKETKTNKSTKEHGGGEMSNQTNKGVSSSQLYFFLEDVTIALKFHWELPHIHHHLHSHVHTREIRDENMPKHINTNRQGDRVLFVVA